MFSGPEVKIDLIPLSKNSLASNTHASMSDRSEILERPQRIPGLGYPARVLGGSRLSIEWALVSMVQPFTFWGVW
jgi:hypothetical protein